MTAASWIRVLFFFNDTATTEIYTLSLHDALPISSRARPPRRAPRSPGPPGASCRWPAGRAQAARLRPPPPVNGPRRSEEHTSELQSRQYLVCRLLLEKKKNKKARARNLVLQWQQL